MKYEPIPPERVLAIDPISKGFGFVLLETDPLRLVDWGTATCRRTDDSLGDVVRSFVRRYHPMVLVLEDPSTARSYTRRLALSAAVAIITEGAEDDCDLQLLPREAVRRVLTSLGAANKRQAVRILVQHFPELAPKVPPGRFTWQSEDARWAIFDALTFAVVSARLEYETSDMSRRRV